MKRSTKIAAVLIPVALVAAAAPELLKIPITLAVGWVKSTWRFASAIQLSATTVAPLILPAGVLLVGTHWFCAWVRRTLSDTSSPWRWRWTCGFYAAIVLVLFASAAMVGITHQTGWMISSPEPIFKPRGLSSKVRIQLQYLGKEILDVSRTNEWNFARVKNELRGTRVGAAWEEFAFYFPCDSNGVPDCVILLPRNPKYQTVIGVVEPDDFHTRPFGDLTKLLRRNAP